MKKFIFSFLLVLTSVFSFAQNETPITFVSYKQSNIRFINNTPKINGDFYQFTTTIRFYPNSQKVIFITNDLTIRFVAIDANDAKTEKGTMYTYKLIDPDGNFCYLTITVENTGDVWGIMNFGDGTGIYYPNLR